MPSHLRRSRLIIPLVTKCCLVTLLILTIFFLSSAASSRSCSNQSCSGDACVGTAGSNCAWRSRSDGTMYCYTTSCPSDLGAEVNNN
jgi:hypothetical protein